ncbi:hypothetical protein [Insolitispirillum peregrinum]
MFGFDEVAAFTHHVEGAFQKVRDGQQSISSGPDRGNAGVRGPYS